MFRRRNYPEQEKYPLDKSATVMWPSDTVVECSSGVYLVKGDKKLKFYSKRTLESWNFSVSPIPVHDSAIEYLKYGGIIGFRNGSLLESMADGKMYLISDNKRRHITNPDWFEEYGFAGLPILTVSTSELEIHEEGKPLD